MDKVYPEIEATKARLNELAAVPFETRERALSAIGDIVDHALLPEAQKNSWVARVGKPTADISLPETVSELWNDSEEKKESDKGQLNKDTAVLTFTQRVYTDWIKADGTGMAVSDTKKIDEPLYEELKAARNRMNGRGEAFPIVTVKERNQILVKKILAGEIDPPHNTTQHRTLAAVASRLGTPFTAIRGMM